MEDALPTVERSLGELGLAHRVVRAEGPGDGARWSRASLLSGERFLVAVGGETLVHDVVNGMFEDGRPVAPDPVLGVVPAGTENEFFRQFGMPMDAERVCRHLAGQGVRVHAVLTGPVDTDMVRDLDIPKASPQSVAQGIFDGVDTGEEDIFPDPLSAALADDWQAGPAKALERQNAALLQPQPAAS